FDLKRVSLGGPIFDVEKLGWLNGLWIRENLNGEEFAQRVSAWAFNQGRLEQTLPHVQSRVQTFSDIVPMASFMFSGMLDVKAEQFSHAKLDEDTVKRVLQFSLWRLEAQRHWSKG